MLTMNSNIFPKGGHTFTDADGTKHPAQNWPAVMRRVRDYRKRRGLPEGNVEQEVIAQACANNPGLCREDNGQYQHALKKETLKSRMLSWLNRMKEQVSKEPIAFVSDEERKQRADVCASCPRNEVLPDGCSSCRKAAAELRKSIMGSRFIDGRLNACGILGEDLPTSSHLDQIRVSNSELPGNCWRKIV